MASRHLMVSKNWFQPLESDEYTILNPFLATKSTKQWCRNSTLSLCLLCRGWISWISACASWTCAIKNGQTGNGTAEFWASSRIKNFNGVPYSHFESPACGYPCFFDLCKNHRFCLVKYQISHEVPITVCHDPRPRNAGAFRWSPTERLLTWKTSSCWAEFFCSDLFRSAKLVEWNVSIYFQWPK